MISPISAKSLNKFLLTDLDNNMMLQLVVLCVVVTYVAASIVNGIPAKPGEIPYIVSLRRYNRHSCGGSILDKRHILTAAHCIFESSPSSLSIQYGVLNIRSNENIIPVEAIYQHEEYSSANNYVNDVAVLKLSRDLVYGQNAQPVQLPAQDEKPPGGNEGVLAGWGVNKSGGSLQYDLQRVENILYTDENCKTAHGSKVDVRYQICSGVPEGGKGQCSGDSGGPFNSNGKQWGIVSWSIKPCTIKGYPGVFTRVPSYVDWIKAKQFFIPRSLKREF